MKICSTFLLDFGELNDIYYKLLSNEDFEFKTKNIKLNILKLNSGKDIYVCIQKINLYAPSQLKLLCKFSTNWPNEFIPFNDKAFLAHSDNKT